MIERQSLTSTWLLLPALAVGGACLLSQVTSPEAAVHAAVVQTSGDYDGDGLSDEHERVLRTAFYMADTDADGFSDSEEIARNSNPYVQYLVPGEPAASAGLEAHQEGGDLHLVSTFYLPDGSTDGKSFRVGMGWRGRILLFPMSWVAANSRATVQPAADPQAQIMIIDTVMRAEFVKRLGGASFVTSLLSHGGVAATQTVDLELLDGILVEHKKFNTPFWLPANPGPQIGGIQSGGTPQGPWTIYWPIVGGDMVPVSWTSGSICIQETKIVATNGTSVTHEIVSAECEDGWEGYCSSSCEDSEGDTRTTVDPETLTGG